MREKQRVHWPALDGLRALAVVAVIAFHLRVGWASGGFLGVDLFFVISGFLITSLLLDEHDASGSIGFGHFWSRRVRRLVPPAVAMIGATVVATRLWLVEQRWGSIRGDALGALTWVANWRFISDTAGYFQRGFGPSPLEHTWSLAVEEQFYLVWPVIMIVAITLWRGRPRRAVAALLAASLASAIWMALLFDPGSPDRAYQGTDTRAQQLLVGAMLAWAARAWPRLPTVVARRRARPFVWMSGALLIGSVGFVDADASWMYRGGFLAFSLLCAVVVLAASTAGGGSLALLGSRPFVVVGRRSYGLYLWHWPVIIFVGAPMGIELSRWPLVALQVVVTVVVTEISFRYIENPARFARRPRITTLRWVATGSVVAVSTLVALNPSGVDSVFSRSVIRPGDVVAAAAGPPSESSPSESSPSESSLPESSLPESSPAGTATNIDEPSGLASASSSTPAAQPVRRLLVLGDSTALVMALESVNNAEPGWSLDAFARLGCGISAGFPLNSDAADAFSPPADCLAWRQDWADSVAQVDPDVVVVMVGAWEVLDHLVNGVEVRFPSPEWTDVVSSAVREAVSTAGAPGRHVVLLRLPCMDVADPDVSDRNDIERVDAFNAILEAVAAGSDNIVTAPLDDVLCPGGEPIGEVAGHQARFDGVHLTHEGAALVWHWLLELPA